MQQKMLIWAKIFSHSLQNQLTKLHHSVSERERESTVCIVLSVMPVVRLRVVIIDDYWRGSRSKSRSFTRQTKYRRKYPVTSCKVLDAPSLLNDFCESQTLLLHSLITSIKDEDD